MTYGDLPSRGVIVKLSSIAFSTPGKNIAVYNYCIAINSELETFVSAKRKILERLGTKDEDDQNAYKIPSENFEEFQKQMEELFSIECSSDIPSHGLSPSDFEDGKCKYPDNPELWMTAIEIESLFKND